MHLDLVFPQHNAEEWKRHLDFIPERFNPESEYFSKVDSNKMRSPYSSTPFSHGPRSCPGKTLALVLGRTGLIHLLTHGEFEVKKEQLDNQGIGFGAGSHHELMVKVLRLNGI